MTIMCRQCNNNTQLHLLVWASVSVLLHVRRIAAFAFGSVFVRNKLKMKMKIFEIEIPNAAEQNTAAGAAPADIQTRTHTNVQYTNSSARNVYNKNNVNVVGKQTVGHKHVLAIQCCAL